MNVEDFFPCCACPDARIAVDVSANEVPESVAGQCPSGQRKCVGQKNQTAQSQTVLRNKRQIKVVVKERKEQNARVEEISMEVFKLKNRISLPSIRLAVLFAPLRILASQRMVKQVTVVILAVSVAGQAEYSGIRNNQNRRTVKWIDVSVDSCDWKSRERPNPGSEYHDE